MSPPLNKLLWLWLPVMFVLIQACLEIFLPGDVLSVLMSENGPHKTLQFLIAVVALGVALSLAFKLQPHAKPWLFAWVTCFILGCAYIAGEEISWGQHVFEWGTPEFWHNVNDQGETNLHNTSSWLDQKPRLILEIGILIGGLLIPVLQRYKQSWVPEKFKAIYPPRELMFMAGLVLGLIILDKIDDALSDIYIMARSSEVEEILLFYFVLLYLINLRRILLSEKTETAN